MLRNSRGVQSVVAVWALVSGTACNIERATGEGPDLLNGEPHSCPAAAEPVQLTANETRVFVARTSAIFCLGFLSDSAEYIASIFAAPSVHEALEYGFTVKNIDAPMITTAVRKAESRGLSEIDLGVRIRSSGRQFLRARVPYARAHFRSNLRGSGASAGNDQLIMLNTAIEACGSPELHTGRIKVMTTHAVIVADTANPVGGFTDAQYRSIGEVFDSLIYAADTAAFGSPADIDGNKRVIIFFTRAVNELIPTNAPYVIGGFFHPRDLFPRVESGYLSGCEGSNSAEMMYMLVPDPEGTINGNKRTPDTVHAASFAVLAHELQHLINSSRRLYVNTSADWPEDIWLDEGLAHVAEEQVFLAAANLDSRTNTTASDLTGTPEVNSAALLYQLPNFKRFAAYLSVPQTNSPIPLDRDDDRLTTRGATWSFLRYTADHATVGNDLFRRLVNSNRTGIANLSSQVLRLDESIHAWTLANLLDDQTIDSSFNNLTWELHSVLTAFLGRSQYPLSPMPVSVDGHAGVMVPGGAAYFKFSVRSRKVALIQITSGHGSGTNPVVLTLFRVR